MQTLPPSPPLPSLRGKVGSNVSPSFELYPLKAISAIQKLLARSSWIHYYPRVSLKSDRC